jgi:hypothetical protein
MGILRNAGVFAVVKRYSECGRKYCKMHDSQQVNIGECYLLAFFIDIVFLLFPSLVEQRKYSHLQREYLFAQSLE